MKTRMMIAVSIVLAGRAVLATTYFVDASRPNDAGSGLSWATAKKTIQAAVDLADAGDTILVTNGLYASGGRRTPGYASSNRVVITKNITVRSLHGPAVTIIQGDGPLGTGAVRCVYMAAGLLTGFALTGGYTRSDGHQNYDRSGGGVNLYGGNGVVSNCIISGNRAADYGGGTYFGNISMCTISNNHAGYDGGGAYFGMISGCTISENEAQNGGGTYKSVVVGSTVSGNVAAQLGGGAYGGTLASCAISANRATLEGGGVAYGTASNCVINGNDTTYYGGGVLGSTIEASTLRANVANYGGGAAWSTVTVCTVSANTAQLGGGTYAGVASGCTITGNRAGGDGGGTYQTAVKNCTMSSNNAARSGGGMYEGRAVNSIVWANHADASNNYNGGTFQYSCTTPAVSGTSNITNDPQFLNATMENYRLSESSPCINAGTNLPEMAWETDLDGNPRIYLGDGVGIVDMGCYEYVPEAGGLGVAGLLGFTIYKLQFTIGGRQRGK